MEICKVKNLTYYYPRTEKPAIKEINLSIREGEFILLLGESGSGKSTLGRVFNQIVPGFYGGKIKGSVDSTVEVGMVFQDPEKQLVMDSVEREIAFGLENMGIEYGEMRKKVMETLSFLNMWHIKNAKTYELSGGEKQKTAIGATIAMGCKFLVFDEPTSQLDPVAAEEILHILKRLNEELGYTIILIEQRIDCCFHLADRIWFMEKGALIFDGAPETFLVWQNRKKMCFAPGVSNFFLELGHSSIPVTIKEGRKELNKNIELSSYTAVPLYRTSSKTEVISMRKLSFAYENDKEILKDLDLIVQKGEILGIMGENGGGKSTLLKNIGGLLKPSKGKINVKGLVGYLSQNPNDYLFNDTVYEELAYTLAQQGMKDLSMIDTVLKQLHLYEHKNKNPRDLSGGEKQRVALASILVMNPSILLLDEPTRGLDRRLKEELGEIITDIKRQGNTVILVTHDVEFVGKFCDRVGLLFDGSIAQIGSKYDVLTSGIHYATQMNKLFRDYVEKVLTIEEALSIVRPCSIKGAI
ncbi:ABC transporter ATP-binding protein [Clostridiaceae bacterium 35-E11]